MSAPIPFVRDLDVVYGRADQVSPLVRRVVAENPSNFTYLGTGTYVVGHGDVAVIDPGPLLDAHVDAIVAALEPGERISTILVTHTHSDHSPSTLPATATARTAPCRPTTRTTASSSATPRPTANRRRTARRTATPTPPRPFGRAPTPTSRRTSCCA